MWQVFLLLVFCVAHQGMRYEMIFLCKNEYNKILSSFQYSTEVKKKKNAEPVGYPGAIYLYKIELYSHLYKDKNHVQK